MLAHVTMTQPTERIGGLPIVREIAALRAQVAAWRAAEQTVALVPTMGALHEGHLGLIDLARAHVDRVIVSIFVNPTQFAPGEDFATYPRTLARDCELCQGRGAHVVFAPPAAEMYDADFQTRIEVQQLGSGLCGRSRPHFFAGVATVVLKLLNIAMADVAVFGDKDYQQLQVIRRMVRDVNHPTRIVGAPVARAPDGLAMSSRNAYLSSDQRHQAAAIYRGLQLARAAAAAGERDRHGLIELVRAEIEASGGRVDYVDLVDAGSLKSLDRARGSARLAVAAFFGATRLIDNLAIACEPADAV